MICSNCGKELKIGDNFCTSCGFKNDSNNEMLNVSPSEFIKNEENSQNLNQEVSNNQNVNQNQNISNNQNTMNTNQYNQVTVNNQTMSNSNEDDSSSKVLLIIAAISSFIYSIIGIILIYSPFEYDGFIKTLGYTTTILISLYCTVYYLYIAINDKYIPKYKTGILVSSILNLLLSFNILGSVLGIIVYVLNSKKTVNYNHIENSNSTKKTIFIVFASLMIAIELTIMGISLYSDFKLTQIEKEVQIDAEQLDDFDDF